MRPTRFFRAPLIVYFNQGRTGKYIIVIPPTEKQIVISFTQFRASLIVRQVYGLTLMQSFYSYFYSVFSIALLPSEEYITNISHHELCSRAVRLSMCYMRILTATSNINVYLVFSFFAEKTYENHMMVMVWCENFIYKSVTDSSMCYENTNLNHFVFGIWMRNFILRLMCVLSNMYTV